MMALRTSPAAMPNDFFESAPLPDWDDLAPTQLMDRDESSVELSPRSAPPESLSTPPATDREGAGDAPERHDSYVRLKTGPSWEEARLETETQKQIVGEQFIAAMQDDQLALEVGLVCLEHALDSVPYDRSARAAADTIRTRTAELGDLRDALEAVFRDTNDARTAQLLGPDDPLSAYLKGLYLFSNEAVAALSDLARDLRLLRPDWLVLRRRLEEAGQWYFDGLSNEILRDIRRVPVVAENDPLRYLPEHLEELFWAAQLVDQGLKKKFG